MESKLELWFAASTNPPAGRQPVDALDVKPVGALTAGQESAATTLKVADGIAPGSIRYATRGSRAAATYDHGANVSAQCPRNW